MPDDGVLDIARAVADAVKGGNGLLAAALALVLAVALARRYGGKRFPFLVSDVGGQILTLVGALGGALATALAAGAAPSLGMVWTALSVATAAAGGYSMLKRLVIPAVRKLRGKVPRPVAMVLDLVLWIFDRPDPVDLAEAAGDAAVEASPAPGVEGIVGKPREIP